MADTEYDPHPAIEVAWLVSCNEDGLKACHHAESSNRQRICRTPIVFRLLNDLLLTQAVELTVRKITHGWIIKKQWLNNYSNMIIHLRSAGSGPHQSK